MNATCFVGAPLQCLTEGADPGPAAAAAAWKVLVLCAVCLLLSTLCLPWPDPLPTHLMSAAVL